jgi:hypothetical protein
VYFWRIRELKAELVAAPLTDRAVLPYLIANTALWALAIASPPDRPTGWDVIAGLVSAGAVVLGTLWVFRQNGGESGTHLLGRYTALSWVLGLRLAVLAGPVLLIPSLIRGVDAPIVTESHDVLILLGLCVVYYQRLGAHVRDVAVRAASEPTETND